MLNLNPRTQQALQELIHNHYEVMTSTSENQEQQKQEVLKKVFHKYKLKKNDLPYLLEAILDWLRSIGKIKHLDIVKN